MEHQSEITTTFKEVCVRAPVCVSVCMCVCVYVCVCVTNPHAITLDKVQVQGLAAMNPDGTSDPYLCFSFSGGDNPKEYKSSTVKVCVCVCVCVWHRPVVHSSV